MQYAIERMCIMSEQEQSELNPAEQEAQSNRGQPASQKQPEQEQDVGTYMANLGAGTGVDIGPGAAGEMGGAAQDPNAKTTNMSNANQEETEYPDSGDLPHLEAAP
jgi:hypothetical protein